MEAGLCIEDARRIRVVVAAVGESSLEAMREYMSAVTQHERVELSSVSSFYTEHQKSPFARQPWENGHLRFKFVLGRCGRSPWEDFQAYRRVHGFIGLCHCPSNPDLEAVYEKFIETSNECPSAQTRRLFAFYPSEEQIKLDDKKRQNMVLFPPADAQTLRHHMQTLMQEFAASVLMAFESRVVLAEQMGALLTTPLDSQQVISEDVNKAKKRRLERVQKIMGDYCLLAGSAQDAISHYSTAVELSRNHTGDAFWNAGAIEGNICSTLSTGSENVLDEDIRYRYYEVIQLYRRSLAPFFEVEAALKLARFLCRRELGKDTSREVAELLTGAVEVGKGLSDMDDRIILFTEVARIFNAVHYERKAAFFSRQVAQVYQAQNSVQAARSALQILLLAAPTYGVEKRKTILLKLKGEEDTMEEQPTRDCWSALQMSMLGDILAVSARAGDPLTAWISGARLLRFHYPFITPAAQTSLVSALWTASRRLPPGTRSLEPGLPFVRLLSFPPLPSGTEIIRKVTGKKDWWIESTAAGGPFIYTPISAKGATSKDDSVTWVVGECVEVLVEVANPWAFEVAVQDVSLSVEGASFEAFPVSVALHPNTSRVLCLSGVPRQAGSIKVRGCFVNFTGVTTEHSFEEVENLLVQAAKGVILVDPFRGGERRSIGLSSAKITVTPTLPLLAAHIVGGDGNVVLYEGEIREVHINLTNVGTLPVLEACLTLSGKQRDHAVRIQHASLEAALPLPPGTTVSVPVELRAGHINEEPALQTARSYPLVLVHYAGAEETLKGRRLALPLQIHVRRGLSLAQARVLSMDVPAQVRSRHLDPSNGEGLLKVDPYRGGWSFRVLELELWNPTEVPFDVSVYVKNDDDVETEAAGATRIDSKYSSRVLVPLERLKLPTLEKVFTQQVPLDKAESFEESSSRISLRWHSGRNNEGELNVAAAIKAALQASVTELLVSNPLTFGFRLGKETDNVQAHELTPIEMFVRNNTSDAINLVLSVTCRDVAGANCFDRSSSDDSVLWSGILNGIRVEIPALSQHVHSFVLCFMVPGQYTLVAAAVIPDPIVKKAQVEKPACYCGPPFSVQVIASS